MFTANTKDTILRFNRIIVITSVFLGITMLSIGSPVLGEMFATMAPIYNRKDDQLLENLGFDHEDVNFQTTDALVLRGWFFPSDEPDAPAILYAPSTSHDQRSGLSSSSLTSSWFQCSALQLQRSWNQRWGSIRFHLWSGRKKRY